MNGKSILQEFHPKAFALENTFASGAFLSVSGFTIFDRINPQAAEAAIANDGYFVVGLIAFCTSWILTRPSSDMTRKLMSGFFAGYLLAGLAAVKGQMVEPEPGYQPQVMESHPYSDAGGEITKPTSRPGEPLFSLSHDLSQIFPALRNN